MLLHAIIVVSVTLVLASMTGQALMADGIDNAQEPGTHRSQCLCGSERDDG
jgi:hypothetical protein